MKLIVAALAALALAPAAHAQGGAPPTGLCFTDGPDWAVFANNKATTCDFAQETYFAFLTYRYNHTVHYNSVILIPVRSGATGTLWLMRCRTEKYPAVSALCRSKKPKGMNITISRIIDAKGSR
jgi:hypothetical protein